MKNKKIFLALFAIIAMFFVSSCASTHKNRPQEKTTNLELQNDPLDSGDAVSEPPQYKSPYFEEEEGTYYENEDEEDSVGHEWFIGGLKGFWNIITYPGKVIHGWK